MQVDDNNRIVVTAQYLKDHRISPFLLEVKLKPAERAMLDNLSAKNRLNFLCTLVNQSEDCQPLLKSLMESAQREEERFKNKIPFAMFDSIEQDSLLAAALTDQEKAFVFSDSDDMNRRRRLTQIIELQ